MCMSSRSFVSCLVPTLTYEVIIKYKKNIYTRCPVMLPLGLTLCVWTLCVVFFCAVVVFLFKVGRLCIFLFLSLPLLSLFCLFFEYEFLYQKYKNKREGDKYILTAPKFRTIKSIDVTSVLKKFSSHFNR